MELATSGAADWWIGSCRWTVERYLRSGVPSGKVFLSYYGTDVARFDNLEKGKLRHELGLGGHTPLVGMVAFMYAPKRYLGQRRGLKGHEDLIDAVALCRDRDPRFLCVFVGGAWDGAVAYEERVRGYAAARCPEGVVFMGTRDDAVDLLADLDVLAIPSHSENVGGAVEALLAGVPTVATAVGGLPDLVEDGKTGWLVPPRNPNRLAEAIMEALANPGLARDRAACGRERARTLFDCRTTAREVLNIYEVVQSAAKRRATA
jgi:glycosyltransferase involved in cell wall biosynthesis